MFYIPTVLGNPVVNIFLYISLFFDGAVYVFEGCHLLQLIFTDFEVQIMVHSSNHHDFHFLQVQLEIFIENCVPFKRSHYSHMHYNVSP